MGLLSKISKLVKKFSIARKIMKWLTPKMPDRDALRVSRQGGVNYVPVIYGRQKVGAIKVHKYVTDKSGGVKNELLHLICVFCEGEIESFDEFFFDGVSENDPRFSKSGGSKWFTKSVHLGNGIDPADNMAVSNIPNWTFDHRLDGLAYVYFIFEIDKDQQVWRGEPDITAIIKGRKIYDPRTALTSYSNNPALCLRDFLLSSHFGKGLPQSRIDDAAIINAANFCDEGIEVTETLYNSYYDREMDQYINEPAGTTTKTIKRFTANLILDTSRTILDNTREILGSFRALLPPNYVLSPQIEDAGDPVYTFDSTNIIGDISVNGGSVNDRFNRVTIKYPSENASYEHDEAFYPQESDPVYSAWLAEDNNKTLERTFTFNSITNKGEALQMAEVIAKRSRYSIVVDITALPETIEREVGDIVGLTDETHGWINKPFRITEKTILINNEVSFILSEHEDSAYPWTGKSYTDRVGGTFLGDPSNIKAPTLLSIRPDTTFATCGDLSWTHEQSGFIRKFKVKVVKTKEANGTPINNITVFDSEVFSSTYQIPLLEAGYYEFYVYAVSSLEFLSPAAVLATSFITPVAPTSITTQATNFEITAEPVLANAGLGTSFEFAIGDITNTKGRGTSVVFVGLTHNTEYTIFARTVNVFGKSAWTSKNVTTTANGTDIVDLIGADIATQILPDVITEIQDDLQLVVDASLTDYDTRTEVNNKINAAIELVDIGQAEDPKVPIVDILNGIFDNFKTDKDVKTETEQRTTSVLALNDEIANSNAAISQVNQTVSDLDVAISTQITQLDAKVNDNTAEIIIANQAIVTESEARATAVTSLEATVNNNTASINTTNQAVSTLESATASSVATLTASVNNNSAAITNTNQVVADLDSATATSINSLIVTTNNNIASITQLNQVTTALDVTIASNKLELKVDINENAANIVQSNQAIATLESATAASINTLTASVNNNTTNITSANQAIATLDSATTTSINTLTASVGSNAANISNVSQALATETSTRAGQYTQLTAADAAQISRINEVELDAAGNALAISALSATVNNATTGLSATYSLAQTAKSTADGAAVSATNVTNTVNNPTTGLSATNSLAQTAKVTADNNGESLNTLTTAVNNPTTGLSATNLLAQSAVISSDNNATSITSLQTSVAGAQGDATVALTLATTTNTGLNEYRASAQLKVDSLGNVGFIQLDATPTVSQIKFESDQVFFLHDGVPKVYFDNSKGKYIFNGDLQSVGGTFTGNLSAAGGDFSGRLVVTGGNINSINISTNGSTGSGFIANLGTGNALTVSNGNIGTEPAFSSTGRTVGGSFTADGSDLSGIAVDATMSGGFSQGIGVNSAGGQWSFYDENGAGYGPFTGCHEGIGLKNCDVEAGDIVCDGDLILISDVSNALLYCKPSTKKMDRNVRGVFAGKYDLTSSTLAALKDEPYLVNELQENHESWKVNAIGEGAMNVCGEGGDLIAGDYICSSSMRGKGMRQDDQSVERPYTIAQVRHNVSFESSDQVKMVAVIYLRG